MRITMFFLAVFMMLGVLHFAEETSGAPQMMERSGEEAAEEREVEMRGQAAEEEDVGEAAEDEGPMGETEARNQQSAGNARGIITGPRIVVGAFRKVFKKPSDSQ